MVRIYFEMAKQESLAVCFHRDGLFEVQILIRKWSECGLFTTVYETKLTKAAAKNDLFYNPTRCLFVRDVLAAMTFFLRFQQFFSSTTETRALKIVSLSIHYLHRLFSEDRWGWGRWSQSPSRARGGGFHPWEVASVSQGQHMRTQTTKPLACYIRKMQ